MFLMIMSIWCGMHQMRSTRNLTPCSRWVTMPQWHLVIVFSPSTDMDTSLARQIVVASFSTSKKRAIKLKMLSTMCRLNIGMATKCRLDRTLLTQMWMCMLNNELLWWMLPSPVTENVQTDECNNKFVILFKLVVTRVWTYWLTLWSLMSPNFYTWRWSLVWKIAATVYQNNMSHPT